MKYKHVRPNLCSLTCHKCGYDMHDRKESDPCPECAAPFDIRPDAYMAQWKLTYPIVLEILAILTMPFIAIFSAVFLIPAYLAHSSIKGISSDHRIPFWAAQRLSVCYALLIVWLVEFFAMLFIHSFWPQAFNWW